MVFSIRRFGRESKKSHLKTFWKFPETLEPLGPDGFLFLFLFLLLICFDLFCFVQTGKEVTLSFPGCEGTLTLHILVKVVLSQEEKDSEREKMDSQRKEQEELQERYDLFSYFPFVICFAHFFFLPHQSNNRMYELRSSLGSKRLVALESVSAFLGAYLGGSLCSLSPSLGIIIAGSLIIINCYGFMKNILSYKVLSNQRAGIWDEILFFLHKSQVTL